MSKLVPQVKPDKNGKMVTRWVSEEPAATTPRAPSKRRPTRPLKRTLTQKDKDAAFMDRIVGREVVEDGKRRPLSENELALITELVGKYHGDVYGDINEILHQNTIPLSTETLLRNYRFLCKSISNKQNRKECAEYFFTVHDYEIHGTLAVDWENAPLQTRRLVVSLARLSTFFDDIDVPESYYRDENETHQNYIQPELINIMMRHHKDLDRMMELIKEDPYRSFGRLDEILSAKISAPLVGGVL